MLELLAGIVTFFTSVLGIGGGPINMPDEARQVPTYPEVVTAEVVQVIDGDTIDVSIDGVVERVRYIGIDSPEPYEGEVPECYSQEASAANRALVAGKTVRLVPDEELRDDYDRLLRYVYLPTRADLSAQEDGEETFVNRELLEDGYAKLLFIPPNTEHYGDFLEIRDEARAEERGLWGVCID